MGKSLYQAAGTGPWELEELGLLDGPVRSDERVHEHTASQ
ncbi:hypothetical protein D187_006835 [Cystobacter fuscus DSM 2262]|uniref:Uncharacterized protein n=1 Tax=Cystobacter fuscus (strain ATCC 25194 / DSM 2262 / NBRC 100088 / M29) TaxID=1242864 RepID=S9P1U2_CYSF2|nr:hypothetical protein D187_006835 [Cystobacter fuscus DSM 2262]